MNNQVGPGQSPSQAAYPPGQTPSQANYGNPQGQATVVMLPQRIRAGSLCPQCQIGVMETKYTSCGIVMALFVPMPFGCIACWYMREFVCPNCGYVVENCQH